MEQVNLATHYRPKTFADVVGQDLAIDALKKIARADGITARAIFLKGSYGSGKTTLAQIFGRAMNCENFKELGDVCNTCPSCKDLQTKNTQRYLEYDATVAGNVDAIRGLHDRFQIDPRGRRVVVFDEIHASSSAALNALLKMVENGVKDTIFVFCSTEDIMQTLKSRTVVLDISTIPASLIMKRVKEISNIRGIEISDEDLQILALKSAGHMRDALSILQLYELCGSAALSTSYSLFEDMVVKLVNKDDTAVEILPQILKYNIVDIRNSINAFIKQLYVIDNSAKPELVQLQKTGIHNSMFSYFFSPVAQQALRDEVGTEILLRSFVTKVLKK